LLADGKYEDAIERLGEVLQAEPREYRALRLLARAHAMNGDLEDAQALYEALAEMQPDDTEAHLQLGYLYALRSEPELSAREFTSAFRDDMDYLLHDAGPFVVAIRAVKSQLAVYEPPVVRQQIEQPPWLRSRRGADEGSLALLIDHEGKVVAAQLGPQSSSRMPILLSAIVRATFEPAALNGIPVPAVLTLPGSGETGSQR
jgi:tetratricopeptide (TPR) repeat protein